MPESKFIDDLKLHIEQLTKKSFFKNNFSNAIFYSLFNYGKCFRSKLLFRVARDRGIKPDQNLLNLAAFLEIHHCYTLIHDDLPCMDDDDIRRGKPTSHKKFNESIAVLAGDSLMQFSYSTLSKLEFKRSIITQIEQAAYWATGAKGLLLGQYLDLNEKKLSIEQIWRIHELKTARLIQLPFIWTAAINDELNFKNLKINLRIGSLLGILFQILDDLEECSEKDITSLKHEQEINLFQQKFVKETLNKLNQLIERVKQNFSQEKFPISYPMIESYISSKVNQRIEQKIKKEEISEALKLLKTF
ncbi:polyprenyl synthetase family protein [Bacteriovoracaceae bacterium]|nr:polyprenyl synthetase family protein [Bacteriovoracaceae bacterium]